MAVVSVKVPDWVKEKMNEYSDDVEWPEELRKMIQAKIEELERARAVENAVKILEHIPTSPRGTAKALVRGDRDRH